MTHPILIIAFAILSHAAVVWWVVVQLNRCEPK
jgi:hypothetical protein